MMRLRRILRELAREYETEGFSDYELVAFYHHYMNALDIQAIQTVYERTPDKRTRRAALLLIAFMGNNSHWQLLRCAGRRTDDPFLREIAAYGRRWIDPREAALDDLLDALAQFAQRVIQQQPVYQPRLF